MEIIFLEAAVPLTKTFALANGSYTTTPYPRVSKLTSHHEKAKCLKDLHTLIIAHALKGHTLLSGLLDQPLINESRRGHKIDAPRNWIVFDFDRVEAKDASDAIRKYLPKECHEAPYIAQLSASMQRPDVKSFSAHIFMWLAKPVTSKHLQEWLEVLNFHQPELEKRFTLTPSGFALHWPLDVTSARPAQLIFIAPPRCIGFKPKYDINSLITYHNGRKELTMPTFVPLERKVIHDKINALRVHAGLPEHDIKTIKHGDYELLPNAERGVIHDVRAASDHFLKLNLNGGDSFGYWIDLRQPNIIGNFKGEPYLKTDQIDPDFYKALIKQVGKVVASPPLEDGVDLLAFFATNQESQLKIGTYNQVERVLRLDNTNVGAAVAWLASAGVLTKGHFPHADIIFNPQSDVQYIPGHPVLNTFRATEYMHNKPEDTNVIMTIDSIPPTLRKLMSHMLGGDPKVLKHFVNWLANIYQNRCKSGTAWVLHGKEGTGKSLFADYVLAPLFGRNIVKSVQFTQAQQRFNGFLDEALFVVFEEATMSSVENSAEMMARLKHWVTDSPLMIEPKGRDMYQANNYTNFLFFSNERNPVQISESNRRFNVAVRQEEKLKLTPNELIKIHSGDELELLSDILHRWSVDQAEVRTLVETEDAALIHQQTATVNTLIAEAIQKGDIDFFIERCPSDIEAAVDFYNQISPVAAYRELLERAMRTPKMVLQHEDLFTLFRTLIPDGKYFKNSRTWRVRHFQSLGLNEKPSHCPDARKTVRGVKVEWKQAKEKLPVKPTARLKAVK